MAVQSTLPASFVFEVLKPTFAHLRRTLPYARISVERLPPAELHKAVRTQGVHAFVADSGFSVTCRPADGRNRSRPISLRRA